jgi:threonine-phosphate decarboxylase
VRREVASLDRPAHGGEGWRLHGKEDFSANLNPLGPPPGIDRMLCEASARLDHYPDDSCQGFKEALADRYRLDVGNVMVGAGSSELIRLFPEVFVERGDKVLMPRPTFGEYSFACQFMGARLVPYELSAEHGFRPDVDRMLSSLDEGFKALYLCNPNNPTGVALPRSEVLRLVRGCEQLEVLFFLDETLLELMPDEEERSCARMVDKNPNLFIIRSLTKSFAIPGFRSGYGMGCKEMISTLDRGRQTWNLGELEQTVSTRLVRDHDGHIRKAARVMADERDRVHDHLLGLGARTHRPDAFYFFLDVSPTGLTGREFRDRMLDLGVVVRDCSSFGHPYESYVRFCVKTPEKDELLVRALDEAWGGGS